MEDRTIVYGIHKHQGGYYNKGNFWLGDADDQKLLDLKQGKSRWEKLIYLAYLALVFSFLLRLTIAENGGLDDFGGLNMAVLIALSILVPVHFASDLILAIFRGIAVSFMALPVYRLVESEETSGTQRKLGSLRKSDAFSFAIHLPRYEPIQLGFSSNIGELRKGRDYWEAADKKYSVSIVNGPTRYYARFEYNMPEENDATIIIIEENSDRTLITYTVTKPFTIKKSVSNEQNSVGKLKATDNGKNTEKWNTTYEMRVVVAKGVKKELILCCGAMLMDLLWQRRKRGSRRSSFSSSHPSSFGRF